MKPRFCTQCAGPVEWRRLDDERHPQPVCPRCGHVEWQNPKPTVSALITRYRTGRVEVLLVRRARPPGRDQWDCPGGFVDPDEHPEAALRREVLEELGVAATVGRLVGIFMDRYGEAGESTLNIYYEASVGTDEVRPGSDVSAAVWFPLDGVPEPLAFDNNRQALEALRALYA
ncbi:MAG: NUDIX domain-containing protein [Armatimonadota bacterium]|nr:NUDIX domain-containing protein [Armatimonadota bacterium]MDR7544073.1 NUDIX domain-containing protein [Armatimonadota bacterium]